jgi:hypothetical protein
VAAAAPLAEERLQQLLHLWTRGPWAMARAVKTMARRATKKARGLKVTRVRVTRVMMETSPREEGDYGHNNQLGTKVAATARTVVAMTARAIMTDGSKGNGDMGKKGDGNDGNDGNEGDNDDDGGDGNDGNDDAKWQR